MRKIPASADDGSIEIEIDEAPRIMARGTVPPANRPIEDFDGPTPLPPPYVESDDDWLDADRIVLALDSDPPKIERPANVRLPRMLIAKLAIAAVSVGGLSAMVAIMLRDSTGGSRAPAVQPAASVARATQPERMTVTPIETGEASATPAETRSEQRPQPAISSSSAPGAAARPSTGADPHTGTLMVSSKPPCEIVIDGVATVLTTPQRSIKLRSGTHKVTLFNDDYKINSTFEVVVEAGKATKLIRDLMPKE